MIIGKETYSEQYDESPIASSEVDVDDESPVMVSSKPDPGLECLESGELAEYTERGQETGDDPVRAYLHDIGLVRLLTVSEERMLARKIELARRLRDIRGRFMHKAGEHPSAAQTVLVVMGEIHGAAHIVSILRQELGLPPASGLAESVSGRTFRESIAGVLDPQMVQRIAIKLETSPMEAERLLIDLSLHRDFLPDEVLNVLEGSRTGAHSEVESALDVRELLEKHDARLRRFMDKIEREGEVAQFPLSLEPPVGDDGDAHLGDFIEDKRTAAPTDTASKHLL